jgi:DNA-binding NarL/FixJ family response regulator
MQIVVVEDDPLYRELVAKICRRECGCDVVAEAATGEVAVEVIAERRPQLVVLDLELPGCDGFEVMRRVAAKGVTTRYVVVSCHCEEFTVYRADRERVAGFLDKSATLMASLPPAIAAVAQGRPYFAPVYREARVVSITDQNSFLKKLSEQEQIVFALLGDGLDDAEIAEKLEIGTRTAQMHRLQLSRKLGIRPLGKLILLAQRLGLKFFPRN